jgi:hypothetical protein
MTTLPLSPTSKTANPGLAGVPKAQGMGRETMLELAISILARLWAQIL